MHIASVSNFVQSYCEYLYQNNELWKLSTFNLRRMKFKHYPHLSFLCPRTPNDGFTVRTETHKTFSIQLCCICWVGFVQIYNLISSWFKKCKTTSTMNSVNSHLHVIKLFVKKKFKVWIHSLLTVYCCQISRA